MTASEAAVLQALYERVARQGDAHFEIFNSDYFFRLGQRMPDQTRFFIWKYRGEAVAFSFCTVHGDAIYDHDLGLHETLALPLHLYHVTFRDIVRWALAQGLKHYYSSPFNYDPKLHLRMDLVPLDLYARHCSPVCQSAAALVCSLSPHRHAAAAHSYGGFATPSSSRPARPGRPNGSLAARLGSPSKDQAEEREQTRQ